MADEFSWSLWCFSPPPPLVLGQGDTGWMANSCQKILEFLKCVRHYWAEVSRKQGWGEPRVKTCKVCGRLEFCKNTAAFIYPVV